MKYLKLSDILVIIVIVILALLPLFLGQGASSTIEIKTDNGLYRYSIDANVRETFTGPLGNTIVEIKDGKARILDSDCPTKSCTHYVISRGGEMIVCLPNHVTVTIKGGKGGVDATAY